MGEAHSPKVSIEKFDNCFQRAKALYPGGLLKACSMGQPLQRRLTSTGFHRKSRFAQVFQTFCRQNDFRFLFAMCHTSRSKPIHFVEV